MLLGNDFKFLGLIQREIYLFKAVESIQICPKVYNMFQFAKA